MRCCAIFYYDYHFYYNIVFSIHFNNPPTIPFFPYPRNVVGTVIANQTKEKYGETIKPGIHVATFGQLSWKQLKLPKSCHVYVAKLPSKKLPAIVAKKSSSGLLWATSCSKHQKRQHKCDVIKATGGINMADWTQFLRFRHLRQSTTAIITAQTGFFLESRANFYSVSSVVAIENVSSNLRSTWLLSTKVACKLLRVYQALNTTNIGTLD